MAQEGWTWAQVPDQTGRVAVVTGASSGTGFEAARILAACRATVVLACRSLPKAEESARHIRALHPGARVEVQALDLASLASVRRASADLLARFDRLDLLLNNAGVMVPPHGKTEDGFELQLGTNHFGPFALTGLLLERLLATPGSRVVTMSSGAHRSGRIYADDMDFDGGYRAWAAYGQSKLANLLFAYELQRRLEAAGSTTRSVAAHPGWARTELQRHAGWIRWLRALGLEALLSQEAFGGAQPLLRAATDPAVTGGEYFGPSGFQELKGAPVRVRSTARSRDEGLQRWMWRRSEQRTGVVYPI
ncbi:oxidoreductase [Geothrix edaphica]|uniref:Short-chain dehydrogenase n=1 Tax=Geothrix edaphica TaxID=2927976 RepID=A0ABQ5PT98_9BACT|nr:oxidoreductase [Geothrix edaphica]GLH65746.1 short-chain dehydrogenase [Geothrix edaphica]